MKMLFSGYLIDQKMSQNTTEHQKLELYYNLSASIDNENLEEIKVADIHLPTGEIVAADPFLAYMVKPFSRRVTPGKYPVSIYVDRGETRVAYAKIRFKPDEVDQWILAVTDGMDLNELKSMSEGNYMGFPVDAGLGSFMDAETFGKFDDALRTFFQSGQDVNYYDDVLAKEFAEFSGSHEFSRSLGDWNDHFPTDSKKHNVVMFASGWGDGYYPSFWGLNEDKEIVELIIDFLLYADEEE